MTPEERAFLIVHREFGRKFSRETFARMLADPEGGKYMRQFRDAIAAGIKEDRAYVEKAKAPS